MDSHYLACHFLDEYALTIQVLFLFKVSTVYRDKNRDSQDSGEVRVASRGQEIVSVVPKVYASRVSVAFRVFNSKYDELRPAVSKELHQLHRKIWVYKMSSNWKILTHFYCTLLYT